MTARGRKKKTPADLATWVTKQQAAELIGVTTKTIERLMQEGKIEQATWQRPTGGPRLTVFHPDQVAKLAQQRRQAPIPHVMPTAAASPQGLVVGRATPAADAGARSLLEALVRGAGPAPAPPLFVTVAEASAITGLTQAYLHRAIENGTLPAIRDVGLRIYREDLKRLRPKTDDAAPPTPPPDFGVT